METFFIYICADLGGAVIGATIGLLMAKFTLWLLKD